MPYQYPHVSMYIKKVGGGYPTLSGVNFSLISGTVTDGTWRGSFNFDNSGCNAAVGDWFAEADVYDYANCSCYYYSEKLYFTFDG